MTLRLSVLDQSPIREGGTAAEAVRETIQLAQAVEGMGYDRYWLAEHHSSQGLACTAPEVLIGAVAANTSRIRVGSGGVMLTHYSSFKVAEAFRMLEALYPGRIDLGVGRAPGSGRLAAQALARGPGALGLEYYPQQVVDLLDYLEDHVPEDHPFHGLHAQPVGEGVPQLWLLGSSFDSAQLAGELGLPFSFAQFINPAAEERAADLYRRTFRPSPWYAEPTLSIGMSALCAPTEEEALRLSWSRYCMRFRHQGVPSVETALAFEYSEAEREYIEHARRRAAIGDPQQVREKLEAMAARTGAQEIVLLTITYDFADRVRSYELVARECGLTQDLETAKVDAAG
ncbi:MAG: MsnO8 family LLM class oxidoreductase [Dehalococcoidia bacterium]|nr:MsnO8 family LLM class oxidoreductase [Dehalococcoidia bacterium]